ATRLRDSGSLQIETWRQMDIPGRFLADSILQKIDLADFVVADITRLNFNVTFEVGYAIGRQKRTFLISNKALSPDEKAISQLGVYDTLGHKSYENSDDLSLCLSSVQDIFPLEFPSYEIDRAPIFVLDTLHKTAHLCAYFPRSRNPVSAFEVTTRKNRHASLHLKHTGAWLNRSPS